MWFLMETQDGKAIDRIYASADAHVLLIGDAAHTMTRSMGEGCNYTLLESAVKYTYLSTALLW